MTLKMELLAHTVLDTFVIHTKQTIANGWQSNLLKQCSFEAHQLFWNILHRYFTKSLWVSLLYEVIEVWRCA